VAPHSFRMPDVGEGVAEAELVEWFVVVGQLVELDEPIAEVLTDKASIELPSPVSGRVLRLMYAAGDKVLVGAELLQFEVEDTTSPAVAVTPEQLPVAPTPAPAPPPAAPAPAHEPGRGPLASPSVRRRALEAGIDLQRVRGSGPAGRIEHSDLDAYLRQPPRTPAAGLRPPDTRVDEVPVLGIRRVIAERMSLAKSHIPHITYVEEVDVTELERLRAVLNDSHAASHSRLTLLPFIVRAIVGAISEHPEVNARFEDDAGVVRRYGGVHVGIATQTPRGLLVPVLRHAETADLWTLATEIKRLATAALDGDIGRDDLSDSTITVTSLGALGGLVTTPVINYPEVAVVGVNKMQVRPVWDGNAFVPRTMMNLSSAFDHRIIDGWVAARFVQRVKVFLELPATMFIEPPA